LYNECEGERIKVKQIFRNTKRNFWEELEIKMENDSRENQKNFVR